MDESTEQETIKDNFDSDEYDITVTVKKSIAVLKYLLYP